MWRYLDYSTYQKKEQIFLKKDTVKKGETKRKEHASRAQEIWRDMQVLLVNDDAESYS